MYVYTYVCITRYIYVYTYIYIHIYIYIYTHTSVYIYIYMYIYTSTYIVMRTYIHVYSTYMRIKYSIIIRQPRRCLHLRSPHPRSPGARGGLAPGQHQQRRVLDRRRLRRRHRRPPAGASPPRGRSRRALRRGRSGRSRRQISLGRRSRRRRRRWGQEQDQSPLRAWRRLWPCSAASRTLDKSGAQATGRRRTFGSSSHVQLRLRELCLRGPRP